MKKVAIFGKPGGGKSTFSKKLSIAKDLQLYALDLIEYKENGERISPEEYAKKHNQLINSDNWIIEGLGTMESFWQRVEAADTLIYIDLPYYIHYWWVTKRLLKSFFVKPEGWPEGSSVFKGTLASWKYLKLSPNFWNNDLLERINARANHKKIIKITSIKNLNNFIVDLL